MAKQLGYPLPPIVVYEASGDYLGKFVPALNYININKNMTLSANNVLGTPAHEYGHYLHCVGLWGLINFGLASEKTRESFAPFYEYATRHFAYKNGFGLTVLPGMSINSSLSRDWSENLDIAPFTNYSNFSNTTHARWASYLWELYDGDPNFTFGGDNDDIAYPKKVIQAFTSVKDIFHSIDDFPAAFKKGLGVEKYASIDRIYNFTVGNSAPGMKSQSFNSAVSMSVSSNTLTVNLTYQTYDMQQYFPYDNIRNLPTSFRLYRQLFLDSPWEYVGAIPYVTGQTTYSQNFNMGVDPKYYNYKLYVSNNSGESAEPYSQSYHGGYLTITGPDVVCYEGSTFKLNNPPYGATVQWFVSGPLKIVSSSNQEAIIAKTGTNNGVGTINVYYTSQDPAYKVVSVCPPPEISGSNSDIVCTDGTTYTLSNSPGNISWIVSNTSLFTLSSQTNTSVKVTKTGTGTSSATLSASFSGTVVATRTITACTPPVITGSSPICYGTPKTFSATNWQTGYYWDKSNNLVTISNTTASSTSISAASSSSNGLVTVSVKSSGGATLATYNVWVGVPRISYIYGSDYVSYYGNYEAMLESNLSAPTSYLWRITGGSAYIYDNGVWSVFVDFYDNTNYSLYVKAYNTCGWGSEAIKYIYSGYKSSVYPNPVKDILTIEMDDQSAQRQANSPTYDIRLYDGMGNLVRQTSTKSATTQFNVNSLLNGVYYLHIYDGISATPEIQQIVVQH